MVVAVSSTVSSITGGVVVEVPATSPVTGSVLVAVEVEVEVEEILHKEYNPNITIEEGLKLALKALKKDPWEGIDKKYGKGDIVKGKVTKFNPFGAFVQIDSKIQGLIHVSEIGTRTKMEEKLKIGDKYDFKILSISPEEHKMSLKLAQEEAKEQ